MVLTPFDQKMIDAAVKRLAPIERKKWEDEIIYGAIEGEEFPLPKLADFLASHKPSDRR